MKASDLIEILKTMVERYGDHPVHAFESQTKELEDVCNVAFTVIPQGYGWFEIYTEPPMGVAPTVNGAPAAQPVVFGETKFG